MVDEAKLRRPIHSTFEVLILRHVVRSCCEELGHSVGQCWLQVLQFLVHHIDLLRTLLRCNSFAWIQKAVVDQTGSRPPNSGCELFFGAGLDLGNSLELLSPTTELVIARCHMYKFHFYACHNQIEKWFAVVVYNEKMTLQKRYFLF